METEQKEQFYIEMLKMQLEEQKRYMDELRAGKHDMQAHLIVLQYYLAAGELVKAQEYLSQVMRIPCFSGGPTVDVGNGLVNAVLSFRLHRSAKQIELKTRGLLPEAMTIEDVDLCVLFSNLISNSVEACEKLTHRDRVITLEIRQDSENLTIIIENPIEWKLDTRILGKGTTKEDKDSHGYGLRNIQKVVEKYGGELLFDIHEEVFGIKIIFPNVVKDTSV